MLFVTVHRRLFSGKVYWCRVRCCSCGGYAVKNVDCVVDLLEEEGDYVATSDGLDMIMDNCDMWHLLVS